MEHLTQGAEILRGFTEEMQNKFPTWTKEQQLKGGVLSALRHFTHYDIVIL